MNQPAANGPTISFDEFGPLEVRPQPGQCWRPTRGPKRLPAAYTRKHGVCHWLAFYDIHANKLWGYTRHRKRAIEILEVLKLMRKRYPPEQRIHLILDNLSAHGTPKVRRWCWENNIHLIWTPTNASWLNPIECQFTPVKEFVIRNSNYADHSAISKALRRYADYRNRYAKRKS